MGKKKILLDIDEDLYNTLKTLQNSVLEDDDFSFFKIYSCSDQSWFRYVMKMGSIQIKRDLEKWKKEGNN